ncbi:MAG TPA: LCP family protein [Pseudonocardiaceae bacterium]|nr:LCP family protein [Pseudonocardiaceae bacterium]
MTAPTATIPADTGRADGTAENDDTDVITGMVGPPPDASASRRGWWAWIAGRAVVGLVSLLVLGATGYAWAEYRNFNSNIKKSDVLDVTANGSTAPVPKSLNGDTNILIMGLDSRLDENGNPLPQAMYDALHAGDASEGGHNANVLMLLHVPGNGSRATAISIPRDDYVSFPNSPDGFTHGKIKEAYGYAYIQKYNKLAAQGVADRTQLEQQSRDAGRLEEIDTVRQFLGGVPIDHFVEVTLAAFLEIAQAVQPITVCLQARTRDTYSGANFQAGQQQLNADQAVAFVRQRRDNVYGDPFYDNFTDLDRETRQQAFIVSLAYQLKQAGTFTSPAKMSQILSVAEANMAIDNDLDLLTFAQEASNLTGGDVTFYTMPIKGFSSDGSYNLVDLNQVQAIAHQLLTDAPSGSAGSTGASGSTVTTTSSTPTPTLDTVDVVNDSYTGGRAATVADALAANGYGRGDVTSGSILRHSVIYYGSGDGSAASTVAGLLNITAYESSPSVPAGHLRVEIGDDFHLPSRLSSAASSSTNSTTTTPTTTVDTSGIASVSGGGVPCVK